MGSRVDGTIDWPVSAWNHAEWLITMHAFNRTTSRTWCHADAPFSTVMMITYSGPGEKCSVATPRSRASEVLSRFSAARSGGMWDPVRYTERARRPALSITVDSREGPSESLYHRHDPTLGGDPLFQRDQYPGASCPCGPSCPCSKQRNHPRGRWVDRRNSRVDSQQARTARRPSRLP